MHASQIDDSIQPTDRAESPNVYADPGLSMAPSAHMYALAEEAFQHRAASTGTHLASLIQAATAAAGDEVESTLGSSRQITRGHPGPGDDVHKDESIMMGSEHTIRLRSGGQVCSGQAPLSRQSRKRKLSRRGDDFADVLSDGGSSRESGIQLPPSSQTDLPEVTEPDAPIPIRRCATAIHREPSASSTKYTRPPMSKLYKSLQVTHEGFLQLQAAAKEYMLDSSHPERRDCVGQRGKGDSELVKLRLLRCVKEFLTAEGNGEIFFGAYASATAEGVNRTMIWPTHEKEIIAAVTPLLRRMVTNERQRQYAVETRKSETTQECGKRRKLDDGPHNATRQEWPQAILGTRLYQPRLNLVDHFNKISENASGISWDCLVEYCASPKFERLKSLVGLSESDFTAVLGIAAHETQKSLRNGTQGHRELDPKCEDGKIGRLLVSGQLDPCQRSRYSTTATATETGQALYVMR